MQTLSAVLAEIRLGYSGPPDASCYQHVGAVLQQRGPALSDAVVALYLTADKTYVHVALETDSGVLITEQAAPPQFRDPAGRAILDHLSRSMLLVSAVLGWLKQ